jgi:hypothetical protein
MTDAAVRRPTADGWGLLLPASWWTVDLREEKARRRSVAALAEHQLGRQDDRASLRADLRKHLDRAADDAAAAGGRFMAISLMRVGDVPVPASLTVFRLPGEGLTSQGVRELEAALRPGIADGVTLDVADAPAGPVLRRVAQRAGAAELGATDVPLLVADYWLDPGDGRGLLLLSFSTPLVQARDAALLLFDTVVASVGPTDRPDDDAADDPHAVGAPEDDGAPEGGAE